MNKYYALAQEFANIFSKDPSRKVGALCVHPESRVILSQGYNGFPRGIDETKEERWVRPTKYRWIEHAERNCIYNACRHGVSLEGTTLIVNLFPCADCARAIIQVGIRTLITKRPDMDDPVWGADFKIALEMFQEVGMKIVFI